jgi:hypothetical protein
MFIWLIFGLWSNWPVSGANGKVLGGNLLIFILFVLIGLQIFGKPIHQ